LQSEKYIAEELLYIEDEKIKTTQKGKFLSDGISADLFKLDVS
jgi:oxygen-independent coproporphyrinogen-3 oxidase